jgi:hypothetical protein
VPGRGVTCVASRPSVPSYRSSRTACVQCSLAAWQLCSNTKAPYCAVTDPFDCGAVDGRPGQRPRARFSLQRASSGCCVVVHTN